MVVYHYDYFADAYDEIINDLIADKNIKSTRDGDVIADIDNVTIEIKAVNNVVNKVFKRDFNIKYALAEFIWYLSGNRKLKPIQQFTSGWDRMSDDGIYVNSNYGWCIRHKFGIDQYKYVKELLKEDKNTRQAIIHIKEPSIKESKDVNCTCYLRFYYNKKGELCMTTHMRSNDVFYGLPYDVFQFTLLQWRLAMELDSKIGDYTHIVDNLHMYKRDYDKYIGE